MAAPIRLPGITVYGRLPHKTFPPYKPPIPPIKHYKPPPSHGIGKIPGTIPGNRPGTTHNPIHRTTPKNPGFDANKAAIERNRRQQEIDRRNREEMNRRNAQITQRFLQQQAAERKRQQDEANRQRLARQLRDQAGFKNSWKRKFDNIEYKTRNVKPWQWGVGAGALTFAAGFFFVEGVGAGAVAALSRLLASTAGRLGIGAAGILSRMQGNTNRLIMQTTFELGKAATTFEQRVFALSKALLQVTTDPHFQIWYDKVAKIAYGRTSGYGIAEIEGITYVVMVKLGRGVQILGKFP